ncbi:hypothetical protein DY240_29845 [Jiangella rhizosphaerae]|uniref:Uncharacterized protein n=1 Tax=Jiangella rhizosphaerae TaxID=2293569 RepID=A0A418KGK9_9ACTN|nr:hypothetical protein DY240_29845 [Jiangella rhizosphaerae]
MTDGAPGFSQHWEGDEWVTTYHSFSYHNEGVEPLVLVRDYHGAGPKAIELDQQFRLFHNLRHDTASDFYYKINNDGTQHVVVEVIENQKVRIRTPLLRQYIAARQMDLLLFIDSVVFADEAEDLPRQATHRTDTELVQRTYVSDRHINGQVFSRLLGVKVVAPGAIETCGIWPYESQDDNFPEFIIGEDESGTPIYYTCNPDLLADYFGKNSEAPHYLTAVHFRKEVLQKYYSHPELYEVRDGYLSCAGLWGLHIDNDHDDRVVVFLGDLGRDLPSSERDYWRGFMIVPDAPMSESNFRRSFLAQFADSAAIDLRFREQYVLANRTWADAFGWPLYREPKEGDAYLLQQLRLPLNESQSEFENAIGILAKLLVDAINEKALQKNLESKVKDERGISKLERYLGSLGYPHADRDISYLRSVQELRSKLAAHLKGRDYEQTLSKNLGDLRGRSAIRSLLESGVAMLQGLTAFAPPQGESDGTTGTETRTEE